ncbi:UNVERIFIED_CONTAM: PD-(D/E)XK nuclease family protein [Campylobacter lari]
MNKEHDELVYSKLIAKCFKISKLFLDKFVDLINLISNEDKLNFDNDYSVNTEVNVDNKGRIDILVEDKNQALIIENKIKADIHSNDGISQLNIYEHYLKRNKKYVVICPDYKTLHLEKNELKT